MKSPRNIYDPMGEWAADQPGTDALRRLPQVLRKRTLLLHFDIFDSLAYRGVVDWVRDHGWMLDASFVRSLALPRVEKVDGIVAIIMKRGTADWLRQFGCPIVRLYTPGTPEVVEQCRGIPKVDFDYESIGRMAAAHLLTLGRPHFVFYQLGHASDVMRLRAAFAGAMQAAGHNPTILDFASEHPARNLDRPTYFDERVKWLTRHLHRLPKPMAIFAEDDRFTPDVIESVRLLNLRVPTDVAVLGCENNPLWHGVSSIPISSVDSNNWGMGYAAAGLLARLAAGEPPPLETIVVPARRVVARQSTGTYAGAHGGVNLALQHVRQNFRRPLTREGIADVARMSMRGLQAAYRKELGGTIQDEITRLRAAAAEQLLEETDLKLDAVAAETNLGDAKNLWRVFAKLHGMSPDAWRRSARA